MKGDDIEYPPFGLFLLRQLTGHSTEKEDSTDSLSINENSSEIVAENDGVGKEFHPWLKETILEVADLFLMGKDPESLERKLLFIYHLHHRRNQHYNTRPTHRKGPLMHSLELKIEGHDLRRSWKPPKVDEDFSERQKMTEIFGKPHHRLEKPQEEELDSLLSFVKCFLYFAQDCSNVYFSKNWNKIDIKSHICQKRKKNIHPALADLLVIDAKTVSQIFGQGSGGSKAINRRSIIKEKQDLKNISDQELKLNSIHNERKEEKKELVLVAAYSDDSNEAGLLTDSLRKTAFLLQGRAKVVHVDLNKTHENVRTMFCSQEGKERGKWIRMKENSQEFSKEFSKEIEDDMNYPVIKLFKNGKEIAKFPLDEREFSIARLENHPHLPLVKGNEKKFPPTVENVYEFVKREGKISGASEFMRSSGEENRTVKSTRAIMNWKKAMVKLRAKRIRQILGAKREFLTVIQKLNALKCVEENDCLRFSDWKEEGREEPPRIYFLGGGMAAGKSALADYIHGTEFWKKYGSRVVVVEADAVKKKDPAFEILKCTEDREAKQAIHEYSTKVAEELLVTAINHRRDIVFDGTMTWLPFIQQTFDMIHDLYNDYKKGPGYVTKVSEENGEEVLVEETYWVKEKETKEKKNYDIVVLGVTVEAEIAVQRGIVRGIATGRTVPVKGQLKSHKLFSKNFEQYSEWADKSLLFYNETSLEDSQTLIAEKKLKDEKLQVKNEEKYKSFLKKAELNEDASNYTELYPNEKIPPKTIDRENLDILRCFMGVIEKKL